MNIEVKNYTFKSHTYSGKTYWSLEEGAPKVGTMTSGGWASDGQFFTRLKEHPYNGRYTKPLITKVYTKKKTS